MEEKLISLLNQVAITEKWKNFESKLNLDNVTGNGFLGEFFFGTLQNKDTNEILHLAIKMSFSNEEKREQLQIGTAYSNEIFFYSTIVPTLSKFRKKTLDFISKCYLTKNGLRNECLIFENVTSIGYNVLGREAYLNEEYVQYIFETYGDFHGLSFAYKDQHPEEYEKLVLGLEDFYLIMKEDFTLPVMIESCCKDVLKLLEGELKDNCKDFLENCVQQFFEALKNYGKYSCILHGDCWSNNMMFKYKDKLDGIKLIDFQACRIGSPVNDLSHFFYAGATTDLFQNLDKYLCHYYNSFSKTVKKMGSDPNKVLPFEALKEDWKKHAKYGLFMALVVRKMKLVSNDFVQDMASSSGSFVMDDFKNAKINTPVFKEQSVSLLQHFYENKFF